MLSPEKEAGEEEEEEGAAEGLGEMSVEVEVGARVGEEAKLPQQMSSEALLQTLEAAAVAQVWTRLRDQLRWKRRRECWSC